METTLALLNGFSVAFEPSKLLFCLIGVFLGTAVGVLPGIGPALTVALLLPVTFKLDPAGIVQAQFVVPVETYTEPIGRLFVTVEASGTPTKPTGPTVMESV